MTLRITECVDFSSSGILDNSKTTFRKWTSFRFQREKGDAYSVGPLPFLVTQVNSSKGTHHRTCPGPTSKRKEIQFPKRCFLVIYKSGQRTKSTKPVIVNKICFGVWQRRNSLCTFIHALEVIVGAYLKEVLTMRNRLQYQAVWFTNYFKCNTQTPYFIWSGEFLAELTFECYSIYFNLFSGVLRKN